MDPSADSTLLRVTGYLALLVVHAAQEGRARLYPEYLANLNRKPVMIDWLFELASEAELGEECELSNAVSLLDALPGETPLLIVDPTRATVVEKSAQQALADEEANMVGVAILAKSSPEWIYWRPVSHPIGSSRVLILPSWR